MMSFDNTSINNSVNKSKKNINTNNTNNVNKITNINKVISNSVKTVSKFSLTIY